SGPMFAAADPADFLADKLARLGGRALTLPLGLAGSLDCSLLGHDLVLASFREFGPGPRFRAPSAEGRHSPTLACHIKQRSVELPRSPLTAPNRSAACPSSSLRRASPRAGRRPLASQAARPRS